MMKRTVVLVLFGLLSMPGAAAVIDRIAATVDRDVITLTAVDQMIAIRLLPRNQGEEESAYRRRVLDALIAQALRYRDVQRFGAPDIAADAIESRLRRIVERFPSETDFANALVLAELTPDEVRGIIKRRLQVEAYIEERFSPLIFVSLDEIEAYYNGTWLPQRRDRGLPAQPLSAVREEIRTLLKQERLATEIARWTAQLRARSNVDVYLSR